MSEMSRDFRDHGLDCGDRRNLPSDCAGHTDPAMTLVVDETQAFRQIAFVHESSMCGPARFHWRFRVRFPANMDPLAHGTWPPSGCMPARGRSPSRDPDDIYTIRIDVPPVQRRCR